MSNKHKIVILCCFLFGMFAQLSASEKQNNHTAPTINVKEFILKHISDDYEWHLFNVGEKHIAIPLPIIVYSSYSGWHVFMSSEFHNETLTYQGLQIADSGEYKGKIVEKISKGQFVKPFDISITKNVFSLLFSSTLLIIIILWVASSYRKHGFRNKRGFILLMEMLIENINDEVIKPSIGKGYEKYSPYLLTVFFFIFINNLIGIVPLFPGGANVTGNIAITFVLALITFLIVNISGSKEYWREILWPDVPMWLKVPIPLMPVIELVGIFTKPFALMLRLFANIMAGHAIVLGLTFLIFITVSRGPALNSSMTVLSVVFSVFMGFVELLVAYIQALIFTLLSAVFIGLARVEPHARHK